jgi:hypothetical protein
MLKMTKSPWGQMPTGGMNRRIGEPINNRYFILTGMTVKKFLKIVDEKKIAKSDTVYVSPSVAGPIDAFEKAAPKLTIYDLRKYDEKGIAKELKQLGHTVIEIGK